MNSILTPNVVEFGRLWRSLFGEDYKVSYEEVDIFEGLEDDVGEITSESKGIPATMTL